MTIETTMLDTWDAAIVARFDALRSPRPADSVACALTMTSDCLARLDQTLVEIRKRGQRRSGDAVARGPELTALRSAAVEVAAGAYVDGLRRRRRHLASDEGTRASVGLPPVAAARQQASREPVLCLLSPRLLSELDEVLTEAADGGMAGPGATARPDVALDYLRSAVVESAVSAWLILRGYATVTPFEGHRRGWLASVRYLVAGRRRDRR